MYLFDLGAELLRKKLSIVSLSTDRGISYDKDLRPFDNHLYISFEISDEERAANTDEELCQDFMEPVTEAMSLLLNEFGMVETLPLPTAAELYPDIYPSCLSRRININTNVGKLPVRFTALYDSERQAVQIVVELLARHVGNYYRTIINGPLHGHKMPLRRLPEDGDVLIYHHLPAKELKYMYGDTFDWSRLFKGLDERAVSPRIEHTYKIKGDYCYYLGEQLRYSVD